MPMTSDGVLQTATTIAKTTQTLVGAEIDCGGYEWLTLFFDYTKGNETGLILTPFVLHTTGGTAYPVAITTATGGAYTVTDTKLTITATKSGYITFDVRGISFMKFTQGGSNNDGTPTGTLAVAYTLKSVATR
jgi:hypothetical protein